MSKIIEVLIDVVIFTSLIGTIAVSVVNLDGNVTGTAKILIGLTTLFVAIGFILLLLKKLGVSKGR